MITQLLCPGCQEQVSANCLEFQNYHIFLSSELFLEYTIRQSQDHVQMISAPLIRHTYRGPDSWLIERSEPSSWNNIKGLLTRFDYTFLKVCLVYSLSQG